MLASAIQKETKAKGNSLTDNYGVIWRWVYFICLLMWCGKIINIYDKHVGVQHKTFFWVSLTRKHTDFFAFIFEFRSPLDSHILQKLLATSTYCYNNFVVSGKPLILLFLKCLDYQFSNFECFSHLLNHNVASKLTNSLLSKFPLNRFSHWYYWYKCPQSRQNFGWNHSQSWKEAGCSYQ